MLVNQLTKEQYRHKLFRLYNQFQYEDAADFRDIVGHKIADEAYRLEQKKYWLQWGEQWTWRDAVAMREAA